MTLFFYNGTVEGSDIIMEKTKVNDKRSKINKRVGKAIQHALKRKGITQEQLAAKVGTTQRSISAYVRGEQQPSIETLATICQTLNLNLNQILHLKDTNQPYRVLKDDHEQEFMAILDDVPLEKRASFTAVVKALKDLVK